jgi:hypothetical protein
MVLQKWSVRRRAFDQIQLLVRVVCMLQLLKIHGRIWRAAMWQTRAATNKWIADLLLKLRCCMSHALGVFELRCGRVRSECGGATNAGQMTRARR